MPTNESEIDAELDQEDRLSSFIQHIELYNLLYLHTNLAYDNEVLNILEEGFQSHETLILKKLEAEEPKRIMGKRQHDAFAESYIQQMKEHIPAFVWRSSFLSFYATLEHSLNDITEIVRLYQEQVIKIKEVTGRGIGQCKLYLIKVCQIDLSSMDDLWKSMELYNKIRNIMIHSNGYLTEGSQVRKEDIERIDDIAIKNEQLVVNKKFCQTFLSKMDKFFLSIMKCITAKYPQDDASPSIK